MLLLINELQLFLYIDDNEEGRYSIIKIKINILINFLFYFV
jgi:hypothetical protein